jgi:hypothetical protein
MHKPFALGVLVVLIASTRVASAFTAVLTSDTTKTRIEVTDLPGAEGKLLVGWDDVPGTPAGALVFTTDHGASETRYFAIGGGPFSIIDRGGRTLVAGTVVQVFDIITSDADHPLRLKVALGRDVKLAALTAKYNAFEHVAAATETRAAIETAVTARATQVNKTCGSKLATRVQWPGFTKASRLVQAKQAIAVLDAIDTLCADVDYRTAIQRLKTMQVEWGGAKASLFAVRKDVLVVSFGDATFNPREAAAAWLTDQL